VNLPTIIAFLLSTSFSCAIEATNVSADRHILAGVFHISTTVGRTLLEPGLVPCIH